MLYISAITQRIHTTRTCSVTRRNHAVNLETSTSAAELARTDYVGCKRCGADLVLAQAATPTPDWSQLYQAVNEAEVKAHKSGTLEDKQAFLAADQALLEAQQADLARRRSEH